MSRNATMAGGLRDGHREPGMSNPFFDRPILNSPYEYPRRHWELDEAGQPTQKIIDARRGAKANRASPKGSTFTRSTLSVFASTRRMLDRRRLQTARS
jgi:hypothetical protein